MCFERHACARRLSGNTLQRCLCALGPYSLPSPPAPKCERRACSILFRTWVSGWITVRHCMSHLFYFRSQPQFPFLNRKATESQKNKQIDGRMHWKTDWQIGSNGEILLLELEEQKIIPETLFPSSRGLKSNLVAKWNCQEWKTRLGRSSWGENNIFICFPTHGIR